MSLFHFVHQHPRLLALARRVKAITSSSVSTNYRRLEAQEIKRETSRLRSAWQSEDLPNRQRNLVDRQVIDFRHGRSVPVYDVFVKLLRPLETLDGNRSLLEVGCSSGYYSEVMTIANSPLTYTGCDYSEALIALARERYPNVRFDVEDATHLSYEDGAFDIVVSGCCLQHIPEYDLAIAESARVAKSAVIFHRTPVLIGADTAFFRKQAYGIETFEIHFSEEQLLTLFEKNGLAVVETIDISKEILPSGNIRVTRSYACSLTR